METEKAIEVLLKLKKGNEEVINTESKIFHKSNDEDTQHYKCEIEAIETIINSYLKEKARADKIEKDYSKALTKIDELKSDLYEANNIISDYIDTNAKKDKMIELTTLALAGTDFDQCCDYCNTDICTAEDDIDERAKCIKQYFENKAEESE